MCSPIYLYNQCVSYTEHIHHTNWRWQGVVISGGSIPLGFLLAHSPNAHSVLFTGGRYMFTIIKQVALKEKLDWLVGLTTMKAVWRSV